MTAVKDPEYNDALYGDDGTRSRCERCGRPADYLHRNDEDIAWAHAPGWCLVCRPRRGRPPHHGERHVRAFLAASTCSQCDQSAQHAVTGAGDPALSQMRRGKGAGQVSTILARATLYCEQHVPVAALEPSRSAARHPYADAERLRGALLDPRATSMGAVARLLGVVDGGTTTRSLQRNHAMHTAADPTFPPLPQPRTQAQWGALSWVGRQPRTRTEV